jgi:hypothetical protein
VPSKIRLHCKVGGGGRCVAFKELEDFKDIKSYVARRHLLLIIDHALLRQLKGWGFLIFADQSLVEIREPL